MPKIKNPRSFSEVFGVDTASLAKAGVLDPVLNVDTKLFIDPLLLPESRHPEINVGAVAAYKSRFETLVKLLAGSKAPDDVAWRAARRLLTFPEIQGTCIGYGAASIAGHSWGNRIRERVLTAAKEIVELGITDPDLFMVVALLEDGVGPDLISDMTTNIILPNIAEYTARTCKQFKAKTQIFALPDGSKIDLPRNPFITDKVKPVLLVPLDILRELPIVTSWEDVGDAASKNSELRNRVNSLIGRIWEASVRRRQKQNIRAQVYSNKQAFEAILETIRSVPKTPYDSTSDPEGHFAWVRVHHNVAKDHPLHLVLAKYPTLDDVHKLATKIVEHYQELVENKGLWKELWYGNDPRPEKSAQRIFFAVADAYCRANNIDISPEADSGVGPVDFKVSAGYDNRVLVELKLSTNPKMVQGYERQLAAYKKAEGTSRAIYLVVDVGAMGNKDKRLLEVKNAAAKRGDPVSDIVFVNGKKQKSASKK